MCVMSCSNDQELCFLKGFEMGGSMGVMSQNQLEIWGLRTTSSTPKENDGKLSRFFGMIGTLSPKYRMLEVGWQHHQPLLFICRQCAYLGHGSKLSDLYRLGARKWTGSLTYIETMF